ncbi:Hypothetical predicted protein, partial [Olea europaea subsp. europaea]
KLYSTSDNQLVNRMAHHITETSGVVQHRAEWCCATPLVDQRRNCGTSLLCYWPKLLCYKFEKIFSVTILQRSPSMVRESV